MKIKIKKNKPMSVIIKTTQVKPELEDLEITPSGVEQNFKSSKYGYNHVKVKAVESEELTITPNIEEQVKEGMFNKVTIAGDEDLKVENIKEGVNIFGVEGTAKTTKAKITSCYNLFYKGARFDYVDELLALCDWNVITDCEAMFSNCGDLTELDVSKLNTKNVTTMRSMFATCDFTTLDLRKFNTSNVTNMQMMFAYSTKFKTLDLSNFDMSKVINVDSMFSSCNRLENFTSFKNLGKGYTQKTTNYSPYTLSLSNSSQLTHDSLMSVINNLYDLNLTYDVANGGTLYTQKLILSSKSLKKLTAEEIAIATNKGWNVT